MMIKDYTIIDRIILCTIVILKGVEELERKNILIEKCHLIIQKESQNYKKKYIILPSSESELIQTGMWMIRSLSRVVKEKSVHIVSKYTTQITYQLHKGSSLLVNGETGQIPLNHGVRCYIIDSGTNRHDLSRGVMPWEGHNITCVIVLPKCGEMIGQVQIVWLGLFKCQCHARQKKARGLFQNKRKQGDGPVSAALDP